MFIRDHLYSHPFFVQALRKIGFRSPPFVRAFEWRNPLGHNLFSLFLPFLHLIYSFVWLVSTSFISNAISMSNSGHFLSVKANTHIGTGGEDDTAVYAATTWPTWESGKQREYAPPSSQGRLECLPTNARLARQPQLDERCFIPVGFIRDIDRNDLWKWTYRLDGQREWK